MKAFQKKHFLSLAVLIISTSIITQAYTGKWDPPIGNGKPELKAVNYIPGITYIDEFETPIIIDGIIDAQWNAVDAHEINVQCPTNTLDATIYSATWKMGFTDSEFYVLLQVDDDEFCDLWCAGAGDWQADRVEVFFDVHTENLNDGLGASIDDYGPWKGHYQYTTPWTEGMESDIILGFEQWPKYVPIDCGYIRDWDYYTYEMRIPFSSMTTDSIPGANGPFVAEDGIQIGFEVKLIDVDSYDGTSGGEPIRKILYWKGVDGWINMDNAGIVQLAGTPTIPPVANFTANKTSVYVNEAISFTDNSTGSVSNWAWSFGDEGTSTDNNPSHTYSTAGDYTVSLTVTNSYGSDTETKVNYIHVEDYTDIVYIYEFEAPVIIDGHTDAQWTITDANDISIQSPSNTLDATINSATWRMGYTESDFYVLLEVDDDEFCDQWCAGGYEWQSDMVQVYFDVHTENLNDGLGASYDSPPNYGPWKGHYLFCTPWTEGMESDIITGFEQFPKNVPIDCGYSRDGDDYVCEMRIPFSSLTIDSIPGANGPFVAEEGIQIGFEVAVVDVDSYDGISGGEPIRKFINWIGIDGWYNMDNAGIVQLAGTPTVVRTADRNENILRIYPNPAKSSCVVHYSPKKSENVTIAIYNSQGQLAGIIYKGILTAGNHEFKTDISGLPAGLYYVSLNTDSYNSIRKLIITK